MLRRHGIVVERLQTDWKGTTEVFVIDEIISTGRPYQGHILKELKGRFDQVRAATERQPGN